MGNYATTADLFLRLSDLHSGVYRNLDGSMMNDEPESDIAAAEAEINGAIGVRYTVPVASASAAALLKAWTLTLAEDLAWSRSGKDALPKNLSDRLENVRRCLREVAKGEMDLPGAVENTAAGAGSVVLVEGNRPEFTREKLTGF